MKTKECENCDGSGTISVRNCHNNSNECCGGCYKDVTCEDCNGDGQIEMTEEEIEERIERLEADLDHDFYGHGFGDMTVEQIQAAYNAHYNWEQCIIKELEYLKS